MHQTARTFLLRCPGYGTKTHSLLATCSINYLQACFISSDLDELANRKKWKSEDFDSYASYLDKWPFLCYAIPTLRAHYEMCDTQEKPALLLSQLVDQLVRHTPSSFVGEWIGTLFQNNTPNSDYLIHLLHNVKKKFRPLVQLLSGSDDRVKYPTLNAAVTRKLSQATEAILTTCNEYKDRSPNERALMICVVNGYETAVQVLLEEQVGRYEEVMIDALSLALKKW